MQNGQVARMTGGPPQYCTLIGGNLVTRKKNMWLLDQVLKQNTNLWLMEHVKLYGYGKL